MSDEFVTSGSELGTHTRVTKLRSVDHIRIMFDTHAHGERLLYDIESLRTYHLIGITSRVPYSENERITLDTFASVNNDGNEPPFYYLHISHTGTESDICSE